ncbi:MAG TPA: hypothetical protein VGM50_14880, partial [Gemmatimonadaceae bacterium]
MVDPMMILRCTLVPLTAALSLVVGACADAPRPPRRDTASTTPSAVVPNSASGDLREAATDSASRTAPTTAVRVDSTSTAAGTKPSAKRATSDSAILIQIATQPKLRTKADSISLVASIRIGLKNDWPVKTAPALPGAILPAKRIVAFYGNPLSKRMGILGEIPYDQMLTKLDSVVASWRAADPSTPVQPALHLIVSVAQGQPGKDGMYRQRSDPDLIEKIYNFAKQRGAITILDIQAGKSTIEDEIPILLPFLQRPDVHLGLDPEFNMHYNREG